MPPPLEGNGDVHVPRQQEGWLWLAAEVGRSLD